MRIALCAPTIDPAPTEDKVLENAECDHTKHIVHDNCTHEVTPPEEAGGRYICMDANWRAHALARAGIPSWLFVAEEDKWHAELYSEYFFDQYAASRGGSVDLLQDTPEQKIVREIKKDDGSTELRYTKYYKQMGFGHASWKGAYSDPDLAEWLLAKRNKAQ